MSTLSEFLKIEENQSLVRERIVRILRSSESWGKRGLFVKIANETGFSAAYVGQVLTAKKPLTDDFVCKISDYLGVSVAYLRRQGQSKHISVPYQIGDDDEFEDSTEAAGTGKTPPRVTELLKGAVAATSHSIVAEESGLTLGAVHRYIDGVGYPSDETFEKLAKYFGVTTDYLRGEENISASMAALGRMLLDFINNDISKTEDQVFETVLNAYKEDNPNLSEEVLKERTSRFIDTTMSALFQALKASKKLQ